jgi:hypothetical protein
MFLSNPFRTTSSALRVRLTRKTQKRAKDLEAT